ncbi:putative pentatricopeptide repeat-containing protein At3g13770, mitochondrial [Apium graveolens]|uniref:putative pentatricopeptide repeat-containing protein At3g13770, mitochondrial n=1 Tax=Apium graveolens TaxID=4045 RepID=UPI003D7AE1BD
MEMSVLSSSLNQQPCLLPSRVSAAVGHDSKHWNLIIKQHARLKNDTAILTTCAQMESIGLLPDHTTLPLVLKACSRLGALEKGKMLHNYIVNTHLIDDVRVGTALVDFYCKCGFLEDARLVFDEMNEIDVVAWNAIISGCVRCCEYEEAILLCSKMQKEGLRCNSVTVVALLLACGELLDLRAGKEIHGYCLRNSLSDFNHHAATALIGFYLKFDVKIAAHVFALMPSKNTVSWNAMITAYFETDHYLEAIQIFVRMLIAGYVCDNVTLLILLQACTEYGSLELGHQIHQLTIKLGISKDMYIINALINMYGDNGMLRTSCDLFESISTKDVALWNSMISAYLKDGSIVEALAWFTKMKLAGFTGDVRTIIIGLRLCVQLPTGLRDGRGLQASVIKSGMERNIHVGNALLGMYAEFNCIDDALKVFQVLIDAADVVSWNTLINALARNGLKGQAWKIFGKMKESEVSPNAHTMISILASCKDEMSLILGRCIHGYAIKRSVAVDPLLNTALTEMYMNCNDEATATKLFERFQDKDVISWNSMIGGYVKTDQPQKALFLFDSMMSKVDPNSVTIIHVLSCCTKSANLPLGQILYAYTLRRQFSFGFDLSLANALITMYSRCGDMHCAERIFDTLPRKNIVSWNAMIAGYGMHGRGVDALLVFSKMLEDGCKPNSITFISALSACSHSGLVEKGLLLYDSMVQEFYITPEVVHYACVVDLLCRGGSLTEAKKFIDSMPIPPDASVWRALLSGCRVYSDTKLAKTISNKLLELEPTNAGNYVLLSNIYAAAGLWSEVNKLRTMLEEKGLTKPPGKSWIAVKSKLQFFTAGDKSHPQSDRIYSKLNFLLASVKEIGYAPNLRWVLHDEDDEKKVMRLSSHSEKLAITFGLINIRNGTPIQINKNLRVCGDCHEFGKHVSKLVQRDIVLRDGSRFHHFTNGVCSCKDYW